MTSGKNADLFITFLWCYGAQIEYGTLACGPIRNMLKISFYLFLLDSANGIDARSGLKHMSYTAAYCVKIDVLILTRCLSMSSLYLQTLVFIITEVIPKRILIHSPGSTPTCIYCKCYIHNCTYNTLLLLAVFKNIHDLI